MGILDKVMFWKKGKDDFGDLGLGEGDLGLGGIGGLGKTEMPGFGEMEHAEGVERPLGAASASPKTEEVGSPYQRYGYQQNKEYEAPMPAAPAQPAGRHEQLMMGKELELISTKLDSIKISLDSLNMRVAALERIAKGDYEKSW